MDDIYNWFADYVGELNIEGNYLHIPFKTAYELYNEYIGKHIRRKDFKTKMTKLLKGEYMRRANGFNFVFNIKKTNDLFKELYRNDIEIIKTGLIRENSPFDSDDDTDDTEIILL